MQDNEKLTELTTELRTVLGYNLSKLFDDAKNERRCYEERWLKNLRQYLGHYDADVENGFNDVQSRAFIRLTRTKVRSMDARIADQLFPASQQKNWDIEPTPKPSVPKNAVIQYLDKNGIDPTMVEREQLRKAIKEVAKERCDKMEELIHDQLMESGYQKISRKVIHDANVFGHGVMKGPLIDIVQKNAWKHDPIEGYGLEIKEDIKPRYERVSIWDYYPDLSVTDKSACEYEFQRHVMTKSQVLDLAKTKGFDKEVIYEYLQAMSKGDYKKAYFEQQLRDIRVENNSVNHEGRCKYEVIEFWGIVDVNELKECGCEVKQDKGYVHANVWLLGEFVIKAVINPTDQKSSPFKLHIFEDDDTSILGIGIPEIIDDIQTVFNAAVRMMLDDGAHTLGTQTEVNVDLIDTTRCDPTKSYPGKVWVRNGTGDDASRPAVREIKFDSHINEIMGMANWFKQMADETSTVPSYMAGDPNGARGAAKTAQGLSMLMGQANVTTNDVIKNWDYGITTPIITDTYHYNMQFGEDETVKGDFKINARGFTSLVAKEVRTNALTNFSAVTANPEDAKYIKRGELLREMSQAMDIPENIVRTDDEYNEHQELIATIQQLQQILQQAGLMNAAA